MAGFCIPSAACTSAIISADANPSGRPLLWKHRDTSNIDNKVEYVAPADGQLGYVALFNAADRELKEAWMGMNEAGFAVMNTASYNIKDDNVPAKEMDKEGIVMTIALKTCRTIDDFARLLDTLPRPMGVEANFGVIDASGNGAFFETNNHSYVRFDLSDTPDGILIRSNYSHSGRPDEGFGFIREANACHLLQPYAERKEITPEVLTEEVSRSFWHDLMKRDFADGSSRWVVDMDFIPRYKSTATIVIEGCVPSADGSLSAADITDEYIMWTGLGYPPVAEIVPVWCTPDGVYDQLRGIGDNGHSPMCDKAKALRDKVFPFRKGNGDKYLDMSLLYNRDGTGYAQTASKLNRDTYMRVAAMRESKKRSPKK